MSIREVISVYTNGLSKKVFISIGLLFGIIFAIHVIVYKNYVGSAAFTMLYFVILFSIISYGEKAYIRFREKKFFYAVANLFCSIISLLTLTFIILVELGVFDAV